MKKVLGLLVVFGGVLLLTGCGGSSKYDYVCTAKVEDGDQKADVEFGIKLKNDKIDTVDLTYKFETEEYAQQMYAVFNMINQFAQDDSQKIDVTQTGKEVLVKNYEKISSEEEDDEDSMGNLVGMTKEEFKEALEKMPTASGISCK